MFSKAKGIKYRAYSYSIAKKEFTIEDKIEDKDEDQYKAYLKDCL